MSKRVFDLLFSLLGLALCWPVFAVVWLLVKLDDGGPLFYRQTRIGQYGRPFRIIKFRTMKVDTDKAGSNITAAGDQRITRFGRSLRKSKLDELPQLWNVLRGEMSFVGPRPEVPEYVALYTPSQCRVLELRPGITDEASVVFRDEEKLLAASVDHRRFYIEHCLPQKIDLNLGYANRANLFRDILVIVKTMRLVWLRR